MAFELYQKKSFRISPGRRGPDPATPFHPAPQAADVKTLEQFIKEERPAGLYETHYDVSDNECPAYVTCIRCDATFQTSGHRGEHFTPPSRPGTGPGRGGGNGGIGAGPETGPGAGPGRDRPVRGRPARGPAQGPAGPGTGRLGDWPGDRSGDRGWAGPGRPRRNDSTCILSHEARDGHFQADKKIRDKADEVFKRSSKKFLKSASSSSSSSSSKK